ncbi:MAG: nuclear transport factor 2 family protein [Bacteriovoracaceae bacterium]|nr:nuclear transport factor 2 family protein [Bacteriovoracaceae bacterium]
MKNIFWIFLFTLNFIISSHAEQATSESQMITRKERIKNAFNTLRADNLHILDGFYHPSLKFHDPLGEISGLDAMKAYYANMYKNVTDIRFEFGTLSEEGDDIFGIWNMILKAKSLNGGEEVKVLGVSHLKFDPETNLVIYHRDYFDMGSFIYEHIPILGSIIRRIKRKLGH